MSASATSVPVLELVTARTADETSRGNLEAVHLLGRIRDALLNPAREQQLSDLLHQVARRIGPITVRDAELKQAALPLSVEGPRLGMHVVSNQLLPDGASQAVNAYRALSYMVPWSPKSSAFFHPAVLGEVLARALGVASPFSAHGPEPLATAVRDLPRAQLLSALATIDRFLPGEHTVIASMPCLNAPGQSLLVGHMLLGETRSTSYLSSLFPRSAQPLLDRISKGAGGPPVFRKAGRFTVLPAVVRALPETQALVGDVFQSELGVRAASVSVAAGSILAMGHVAQERPSERVVFEGDSEPHISIRAVQPFGVAHLLTEVEEVLPTTRSIPPILFERYGTRVNVESVPCYQALGVQGMFMNPASCVPGVRMPDGSPCPHDRAQLILNLVVRQVWPAPLVEAVLLELRRWQSTAPWDV